MNIWFMLWVFVAVFIFGIFFWSASILLQQKKAWALFAKRTGLQYISGSIFKSAIVRGAYHNVPLNIFSEEQGSPDKRSRRFRTIIQFELPPMPIEGIITSSDGRNFANGLVDLTETVVPDVPGWDQTILIKTTNAEILNYYLTAERYKSLLALLTIKSIGCIFIFDKTASFLRFESTDPFTDADKLERLCTKISEHAKVLAV